MPRKRVFISYAHADADTFAKELRSQLIMAGHHAFFDIETIVPGSDWEQSILEGIQSADCFIAVVSPSSLQSTPCNREWTHALTTGKYFIPIFLHEEQHLGTIPSSVLQRQGLDFHNPDEYEAKFERLLRTIERLEPIPPPPQAQQEAAPPALESAAPQSWREWRISDYGVHTSRQVVHCIAGSTPLSKAYQMMHDVNFAFRHLLVTETGKSGSPLLGLLSLRRILKLARIQDLRRIRTDDQGVMDVFNQHVKPDPTFIALDEDASLQTALQAFTTRLARNLGAGRYFYMSAIPLIDRHHNAVGIVSFKNILGPMTQGHVPTPDQTVGQIMRGIDKISFSQPDESFADADIALMQYGPGQRDVPIVDGYETRQLVGLVPDHIFIEDYYKGLPIGESMVPFDKLRVQTVTTTVWDMLEQYVSDDFTKLYYSFPVVRANDDPTLEGLVGYRDIFKALLEGV